MGDITNYRFEKIIHYADVLAVPCFLISFLYFYYKQNKTLIENLIMLFLLIGFILDTIFTYNYLAGNIK
jgi:hypothetical protein